MDVLRKELDGIYSGQHLECETLDSNIVQSWRKRINDMAGISNACCVITDASADLCYVVGDDIARLMGLTADGHIDRKFDSSDEDIIYNRIHPEDLVEKRMLEYEFFKHVDKLDNKTNFTAACRIRILDFRQEYIYIRNTTQVIAPSPKGKIWLILCCYSLSPDLTFLPDISPRIIDNSTGNIIIPAIKEQRKHILTDREKEVLNLIKEGLPSKQICDKLGISINTVNRHRQNILEKLSVGNSIEAVMAASAMKLL